MSGKFTAMCSEGNCGNELKTRQELEADWTCIDCQRRKKCGGHTYEELKDMLAALRDAGNLVGDENAFARREKKLIGHDIMLIITELKIRGYENT